MTEKTSKSAPAAKAPEVFVTITNLEKRLRTYNLTEDRIRDHPDFGYQRIARVKTDHDPKTGNVSTRMDRHAAPQSITFTALEKKKNLPAVIAVTEEIKAAKDRGKLKIEYQDAFEPAEEPKAPEPEAKPAKPVQASPAPAAPSKA